MEILCSICCCNLIANSKQEAKFPFTSAGSINSNQCMSLRCGHMFHFYCLQAWLSRSKNCPECRAVIKNETSDFHKIFFNVNLKSNEDQQQDADQEKLQMEKRTQTLTKYIKHITKELGHAELKFDKLNNFFKQEIARKDQEINDLKNLLNQERLCVPLRRQTLTSD